MKLFDYIFYRTYIAYARKDDSPSVSASLIVSLAQFFLLLDVVATLSLFMTIDMPDKVYVVLVAIAFMVFNWYRYEKSLDITYYQEVFGSEKKGVRRRNGYLIVFGLIVVVLFPMTIGVLRHNMGLDI